MQLIQSTNQPFQWQRKKRPPSSWRRLHRDLSRCCLLYTSCTIFKSCFVDTGTNFAAVGALLLLLSLVIEVGSLFFNQVLYRRYSGEKRKVLQYGTLVPNSGFLGTPIAEGVYHLSLIHICASATAFEAAWAKRLELPMTKFSKTYLGDRLEEKS